MGTDQHPFYRALEDLRREHADSLVGNVYLTLYSVIPPEFGFLEAKAIVEKAKDEFANIQVSHESAYALVARVRELVAEREGQA